MDNCFTFKINHNLKLLVILLVLIGFYFVINQMMLVAMAAI